MYSAYYYYLCYVIICGIVVVILGCTVMTVMMQDVPMVNVNYPEKRQWKMSKQDYLKIKLDIEKEVSYIDYNMLMCVIGVVERKD